MSRVVLGDGVALSYTKQGPARDNAVVLLPGPTDSHRSYRPVLGRLSKDLGTVTVSLRGHGSSSKPLTGYANEDLASDVVPLLGALGIERAVLVGHSGSCLVARRVALDAPERVAGLVLEASPTTLRNDPDLGEFVDSVVSKLADPIDRDFARSFIADTSSDHLPSDFVNLLVEDLLEVPVAAWREMFASLLDYDDTDQLPGVSAPVMLIWGDAGRASSPVAHRRAPHLPEHRPHAQMAAPRAIRRRHRCLRAAGILVAFRSRTSRR